MATVTGLTADRMLAIEAASVVDGEVVGDNLILTRFDASTIDAGDVRGATGSPGISNETLNAALANLVPIGSITDFIGIAAPTNWLAMTGQTIVNGQTLYPDLWTVIPAGMKSGSSIIMPNTKGKVSVGYDSADVDFDTIGETGGSKTNTLTQAQLPAATITIDPPNTVVSIDPPDTVVRTGGADVYGPTVNGGGLWGVQYVATLSGNLLTVNIPPFNTNVDIAPFQSGNLGSGQAHNNVQPYVTFLKIIKAL